MAIHSALKGSPLSDIIVTGTDIPRSRTSVKDHNLLTPQEVTNIIASLLSYKTRTTLSSILTADIETEDPNVLYTLGQTYVGESRPQTQTAFVRGRRDCSKHFKTRSDGEKHHVQSRISSNYLRVIKGCYVFGKEHIVRTRHSGEEVRAATGRSVLTMELAISSFITCIMTLQ